MTDDELNKALDAELKRRGILVQCPGGERYGSYYPDRPNYAGDLNACHAVEVGLTDDQHYRFRNELEGNIYGPRRHFISATARQRAEALLYILTGEQL